MLVWYSTLISSTLDILALAEVDKRGLTKFQKLDIIVPPLKYESRVKVEEEERAQKLLDSIQDPYKIITLRGRQSLRESKTLDNVYIYIYIWVVFNI